MAALEVHAPDVATTHAVAGALVPFLTDGDVVLLVGDLGVGKTAFTQGLAAAAGVTEAVTSPTFVLMRPYPTRLGLDLLHVDVYRLETEHEIGDLGLGELVEDGAFALVEWGDRAAGVLGADHLEVRLERNGPDDDRTITLAPSGPRWAGRWTALAGAVRAATGAGTAPIRP